MVSVTRAEGFRDDFATDPLAREWTHHGHAPMGVWDASRQRLAVAWDSNTPNRYCLRALPRELTRADDIRLRFRFGLDSIATADPDTTFPISIGFIRREQAFATNFFRGAGVNPAWGPRNVMEFAYFPASRSISPTLSATAIASHNLRWAMVNLFPFEIAAGSELEVDLRFTSANQTLAMSVARDGVPLAQGTTVLPVSFGEFRLDAISINSYSGDHQPVGYGGQVTARGWIDDLQVEFSDAPAVPLGIVFTAGVARLGVEAPPQWIPTLEFTEDLQAWLPLADAPVLESGHWHWQPPTASLPSAFFRLRWSRP
ncbi:MAG: hypothetical protein JNK85_19410 [Verrucomicrobiales bacterium]|nr:hypothetical protein [Verrucomicrobiales bacterium]